MSRTEYAIPKDGTLVIGSIFEMHNGYFDLSPQISPYKNILDLIPLARCLVEGNLYARIGILREVERDLDVIVIQVHGPEEVTYQHPLVFWIIDIAISEMLEVILHMIAGYVWNFTPLLQEIGEDLSLFRFKLLQAPFCRLSDDAGLDGLHDVPDCCLDLGQLFFEIADVRIRNDLFAVSHDQVRHPLYILRLRDAVVKRRHNEPFNHVLSHWPFPACMLLRIVPAAVIVVHVARSAGPRSAHHWIMAIPTEQFPSQQILHVVAPPSGSDDSLVGIISFTRPVKQILVHNRRHASRNAHLSIDVDALITLVVEHRGESVLPPFMACSGAKIPGVQIVGDVCLDLTVSDAPEYLPDDGSPFLIDLKSPILATLVAVWRASIDLALLSIVHQTAPGILGQVLAVELVHVHHRAQGEPAGRVVAEFLLAVVDGYAQLSQFVFIGQRVKHVAADPVRFVGQQNLEFVFFGCTKHFLEFRTDVSAAADRVIRIGRDDLISLLPCELPALGDLLLNGGIVLGMGGIAGVDSSIYCSITD